MLEEPIASLRIISRDEFKQGEMAKRISDPRMRYFLGDVRDRERLRRAFDGVDIVVHAAALKQVPAGERNPLEFKKTNIDGAQNVIDAALDAQVEQVMALSTDKAADPFNLYGKTKAVAESLFIGANVYAGAKRIRFAACRYGNIVGSRGSIVPLLLEQRHTGIVTLTDARMTRFWMTLDQAARFVRDRIIDQSFDAADTARAVFVPKLPSVRIPDLIEAAAPGALVRVIGSRPGEKLHELMVTENEAPCASDRFDHYAILSAPLVNPSLHGAYSSGTNPSFLSVEEISERLDPALKEAA